MHVRISYQYWYVMRMFIARINELCLTLNENKTHQKYLETVLLKDRKYT